MGLQIFEALGKIGLNLDEQRNGLVELGRSMMAIVEVPLQDSLGRVNDAFDGLLQRVGGGGDLNGYLRTAAEAFGRLAERVVDVGLAIMPVVMDWLPRVAVATAAVINVVTPLTPLTPADLWCCGRILCLESRACRACCFYEDKGMDIWGKGRHVGDAAGGGGQHGCLGQFYGGAADFWCGPGCDEGEDRVGQGGKVGAECGVFGKPCGLAGCWCGLVDGIPGVANARH